MTDWRSYSVVQDKDGDLWGAPNSAALSGRWNRIGSAPLKLRAAWSDELETAYGPITPVLDADGLPVVHTVGDLTARHLRRDISVEGMRTATLLAMRIPPRNQPLPLVAFLVRIDGTIGTTDYYPLDTPCEVLP